MVYKNRFIYFLVLKKHYGLLSTIIIIIIILLIIMILLTHSDTESIPGTKNEENETIFHVAHEI